MLMSIFEAKRIVYPAVMLLGLLFAGVKGAAQSVPPPPSSEEVTAPATLKVRPATTITLGKESAQLEQTALSSVLSKVGVGSVEHRGDAGASLYWICYTAQLADSAQRIWITSDGEMGGREHTVTGVSAEETSASAVAPAKCPKLPAQFLPTALDKGIWIGTSREELVQKLGDPSGTRNDWLIFHYQEKVKIKSQGPNQRAGQASDFDETNILEVRVTKGKVVALRASKVTTS